VFNLKWILVLVFLMGAPSIFAEHGAENQKLRSEVDKSQTSLKAKNFSQSFGRGAFASARRSFDSGYSPFGYSGFNNSSPYSGFGNSAFGSGMYGSPYSGGGFGSGFGSGSGGFGQFCPPPPWMMGAFGSQSGYGAQNSYGSGMGNFCPPPFSQNFGSQYGSPYGSSYGSQYGSPYGASYGSSYSGLNPGVSTTSGLSPLTSTINH
jgi:hypothetical protein